MCVLSCFNVDQTIGLPAPTFRFKINFHTKDCLKWFPNSFDDSVVSQVPAYEG